MALLGSGRAGGATVRLAVDDTAFRRDLVRAESQFKRSTNNMQNDLGKLSRGALAGSGAFRGMARSIAFASGAFLGGAGLTAVLRQSIGAASNLEEQINKINVVFRDSGKEVVSWSKTTAGSLGIARDEALATAGTFGNMLVPMGFARDKAAAMSVQLVKLAADMASFNNANPQEVLDALRAGLAGETEPLRRLGVFLSQARIEQEALNKHLWNGKGNIDAAAKAAATFSIIMKDTADAQGDFARTSGGLANQQRILHARLRDTEAQIGKQLLPTVLKIATAINDWLAKSENQAKIQRTLNTVISTATSLVKALKAVLDVLVPIVRALSRAVGGAENAFKLLFALGIALKIRAISNSFGTGRGGLAGNVGTATGRVGKLRGALASLPTKLVIQVAIATSIYGPAKKFFEDQFGANYEGIAPDVAGAGGSPYPKGTTANDAYQAGKAGKPLPAGASPAERAAWEAGKKAARSPQASTSTSAPSSGGAAPPTSGSSPSGGTSSLAGSKGGKDTPSAGRINWRQYLSANTSPGQYDCSSFVQMVMKRAFGINLPRTSEAQFKGGRAVTSLQEGDLVFWNGHNRFAPPGHVGIYIGGGMVMHDHGMSDTADIVPLRSMASLGYMGARRYVDVKSGAPLPSEGGKPGKPVGKPAGPPSVGGFSVVSGGSVIGGGGGVPGTGFIGAGQTAIATAESVRTGTVSQTLNIPGLGKVLIGTEQKPTIEAIDKQIDLLIKKGKAAVARRAAKQKAIAKLSRVKSRVGRAARQKMIARLRKEVAQLTKLIADIKEELGALYSTRADLVAEQQAPEEAAAQESEGGGGGGDAGGAAPVDITALPGELRLVGAQAAGTSDLSDDLSFLRQEESIYSARLAGATNIEDRISLTEALNNVRQQITSVSTATPPDILLAQARARLTPGGADDRAVTQRLLDLTEARLREATSMEAQIALTNQLADLKSQLNQLQGQENQQLIAFLAARRQIVRDYASNVIGSALGGSQITVQQYFTGSEPDAHIWSKSIQFELQSLVA